RRDVRLIADEEAGLPAAVCAEIRQVTVETLLARAGQPVALAAPDEALMTEMMRSCMGEAIPAAYAPMMLEELGFVPRDAATPAGSAADLRVVIVGAGVSGLILGARLKRLGIGFTILEK